MQKARVRLPGGLDCLLRSEMEEVIRQANLGIEDTEIARRYLIDQVPQIDIAFEIGLERSTVSKRIPRILERAQKTAEKLFI